MVENNCIQKTQKINYFLIYGISSIALGLGFAAIGPLLPSLAEHIDVTLGQISFLFTAHSLGYLLGSTSGGRFYDRIKGHILMIMALGIMFGMSFFIPIVPTYYLLLAVVVIFGLGQGLLDVGMNVNLMWVYQSDVGPYMNGLHFFFGIGALLAPIIVHLVMRLADGALTWPFWILGFMFLPSLIGLFLFKSPTNPEKDHHAETQSSTKASLIILMMTLFFIYVGVEGGFGGWIFSYVTKMKIATEANAAYINSLYWGALTLGRLITVILAKKIKPGKILIGNFLISAMSLGLILLMPANPLAVWLGSAGVGLGLSSVFPTLLVLAETRLKITGSVTSMFFLGSSLGGMVIPMLLGQIFEYLGTYQVMTTMFVLMVVGFFVLLSVIFASNRAGEKVRVKIKVEQD
jgi:FHS family Na+ dependent glucose MFS transporter 1